MIPGKQYTADQLLLALWRRKWLILVCFAVVATGTIVVAGRLPDRYRAEALIVTTQQTVSQDFVRATITPRTEIRDRLPTINQQILSRASLEPIIRDLNLYPEMRRTSPMEAVVNRMRSDIAIAVVDGSESFRISYQAADTALLAVQVTNRLASTAIESNVRDREVLVQATSSFLGSQLEDARHRLEQQEKRLEAYRLAHGPELPTQLPSNMQAIQNVQLQIQSLNDSLNRDRDRRLLVARQLADLQSEQFNADAAAGGSAASATTASADLSIAAQLERAISDLRALETRMTPQHPDVIRARHLVQDLEEKARQEAESTAAGNTKSRPLTITEIAKRNRVKELESEIESLDRQIAKKISDETELRNSLQDYRSRVEAVPTRESELAGLTRDYDTLQSQYRTLLAKKEDSKVAEELERRQVGEQFKVVDPPRLPEKPYRPNRTLIDLAGAAAGLVLGVALSLALELTNRSIKTATEVGLALNMPVIGLIPMVVTYAERRRHRWHQVGLSLGLTGVFAACALVIWFTFRI